MGHKHRDADRERYPDPLFNSWLDESVGVNGATVWHLIDNIHDAKAAWDARGSYIQREAAPTAAEEGEHP